MKPPSNFGIQVYTNQPELLFLSSDLLQQQISRPKSGARNDSLFRGRGIDLGMRTGVTSLLFAGKYLVRLADEELSDFCGELWLKNFREKRREP